MYINFQVFFKNKNKIASLLLIIFYYLSNEINKHFLISLLLDQ